MKTLKSEICIVGAGAIGLSIATVLTHLKPEAKLTLIAGEKSNISASAAAGAMLNVVSEIDYLNCRSDITEVKLLHYNRLFDAWKLIQSILEPYLPGGELLYGTGTEVRLDKNSINTVEKNSFHTMHSVAKERNIQVSDISSNTFFQSFNLPCEKSVDSRAFLRAMLNYLYYKDINIIEENIISTKQHHINVELTTNSHRVEAATVFMVAGANCDSIIRRSNIDTSRLIPSYYGVGSALLLESEFDYIKTPTIDNIVRTPNRGGTCGIHVVQRHNGLYVGASSMTVTEPSKCPRAESVETMLKGFSSMRVAPIEGLSMSCVIGYRPTSMDTWPIIGFISENIYALYGTKRDGLTWAPLYALDLLNMVNGTKESTTLISLLEAHCSPYRSPVSVGPRDFARTAYIESKTAEALQHGKSLSEMETMMLYAAFDKLHKDLPEHFSVHPELVNIFAFNDKEYRRLIELVSS